MTTLEDVTKKKADPSARKLRRPRGVGQAGEGARSVVDRCGRFAQTVHRNRPGNRTERGDDRAPRARQEPTPPDRESTNIRNGTPAKTVLPEAGHDGSDVWCI